MIAYFINSLSGAKEKILSYKLDIDLIDNADFVNMYTNCLIMEIH